MRKSILAIDDEVVFRKFIERSLENNYIIQTAKNARQALSVIKEKKVDVVLLDYSMGDVSAIDVLPSLIKQKNAPEVIIVSGQADTAEAVQCIKQGAFDFVSKPFKLDELIATIENALRKRELEQHQSALLEHTLDNYKIVGVSDVINKVFEQIDIYAPTDDTVLIQGETGTGKELIARHLHFKSQRGAGPFQVVNCAAIPRELAESELFGYKKGAFTGALEDRKGKVEAAQGGTLFLDEIGEMPMELQARLLRFLENKEYQRIGDSVTRTADVRILAATNKCLEQEVKKGTFRKDLFHRLNIYPIDVLPLRDRKQDIKQLLTFFVETACNTYNKPLISFTDEAIEYLNNCTWEGNVRELKNVARRLVINSKSSVVNLATVKQTMRGNSDSGFWSAQHQTLSEALDAVTRQIICQTLDQYNGSVQITAERLGIHRSTLSRKIKELDIEFDERLES